MKNPFKKLFRRGERSSRSGPPTNPSGQSTAIQTNRLSGPSAQPALPQQSQTSSPPNQSTSAATSHTDDPSLPQNLLQQHATIQTGLLSSSTSPPAPSQPYKSSSPPNQATSAATSNTILPQNSAFANAQHVNASHSVFNQAENIILQQNYINSGGLRKLAAADEPHALYQSMPCHNELFTGREVYLEKLRQDFCLRDKSSPRRYFLLHGMGGTGKTQISLRLAESALEQSREVFWVDATTAVTMNLSFRDIATHPDARAAGVEPLMNSVLQ